MPLLYLIRHPHTRVDLDTPAAAWDLSDAGRAQLTALVAAPFWRHVAAVYSSDQRKAAEAAAMVADHYRLKATALPALDEADRSAYTAPDVASYQAAVAAFFAHPETSYRGWETAASTLARFQAGIADVLARHAESESVAVVTHGLNVTLYIAHRRGQAPSLDWWRSLGFCTVAAVDRATRQPLTEFLPAPYSGLPQP